MRRSGLLYLLGAIVVASAAVFAASALRTWRGDAGAATGAAWIAWVAGILVVAALYLATGGARAWEVGTREVVYMATGAALYGVLSWLTNALQLPSPSFVALRPAAAIPLFFGWAFGPAVGFFTGAMGNILGDFLTGWGVFPTWDLGNGLMGMIPGLFRSYAAGDTQPKAAGRSRRVIISAVLASCVGALIGMGFASASSIYVNGYTPAQALGEFMPAATGNVLMALIFVPMLVRAWEGVRQRTGR